MPLTGVIATRKWTPLAVIALFGSLCEVFVVTGAVTAPDAAVRLLLAIAASIALLLLPCLLVFGLMRRPEAFYAPHEYGDGATTAGEWAKAMRELQTAERKAAVQLASKQIAAGKTTAKAATVGSPPHGEDDFAAALRSLYEQEELRFDASAISKSLGRLSLLLPKSESEMTVDELLTEMYFLMADHVRPFTYGHDWIIELADGTPLNAMGRRAGKGKPRNEADNRPLQDLGIRRGQMLVVRRP